MGLALFAIWTSALAGQSLGGSGYIDLEWDADPDPTVIGFVVYVGTEPGRYSESYVVRNQTQFIFSRAVPGVRYYFAVAAYRPDSVIGALSQEISGYGRFTPVPPLPKPETEGAFVSTFQTANPAIQLRPLDPPCPVADEDGCYEVVVLATLPGPVTAIASAGDDHIWIIQNNDRIRVVEKNELLPRFALTASHANVRFTALVPDPRYAQNHFVYVQEVESFNDGTRRLSIARYRDVSNVLGERAVIVPGIELTGSGDAPVTIDDAGRIFLAVPATRRGASYSGVVLGFEPDGRALAENPAASPIVARGFAHPSGIAVANHKLWLSGADEFAESPVASVELTSSGEGWPVRPRAVFIRHPNAQSSTMKTALSRDVTARVFLPLPGTTRLVRIEDGPTPGAISISMTEGGNVAAVTSGDGVTAYVAHRTREYQAVQILRIHTPPR